MTKNILLLFTAGVLVFANGGCTSSKSQDDQQAVENADAEKIEGQEATADTATAQATDPSLEAALGDTGTTTTTATTESTEPTATTTDTPGATTLDETSLNTTTPPPADATAATPATDAAASSSATTSAITETPVTDTSVGSMAAEPVAKPESSAKPVVAAVPMKKISAVIPTQGKDGGWINTVYIVRPKETLADISMKIFGTDKSADLKKIAENKSIKSRGVKAGDKIYYTSPNRPDDSTKTMLYYEDMGMVPETYVAKKGESLKKVSKELLGYDAAWKEVWASNIIDSKTKLKDGDTIRYWKNGDGAPMMANNPPPSPPPGGANLIDSSQVPQPMAEATPPPADASAGTLPPPPADANANMPPPPPSPDMATAAPPPVEPPAGAGVTDTNANMPPPPPADLAPPPPPAEEVAEAPKKKKVNLDEEAAAEEEGMSSDTLMSMGALGVLVALLAFVIIRKKKQKAAAAAEMASMEINA